MTPTWNNGMLEQWNNGQKRRPNIPLFHLSNIPTVRKANQIQYIPQAAARRRWGRCALRWFSRGIRLGLLGSPGRSLLFPLRSFFRGGFFRLCDGFGLGRIGRFGSKAEKCAWKRTGLGFLGRRPCLVALLFPMLAPLSPGSPQT